MDMSFFEELGKTISDRGKEVAAKAKDLTDALQLKAQLSSEKAKLTESYAKIGKQYVEDQEDAVERYPEIMNSIMTVKKTIVSLEKEISDLEGVYTCPSCGASVDKAHFFCGKCGTSVEPESENTSFEAEDALYRDIEPACEEDQIQEEMKPDVSVETPEQATVESVEPTSCEEPNRNE